MRILIALLMLAAAPAVAGTVSAVSFGREIQPQNIVINGVAATNAGGFTVYQHGIWKAPPIDQTEQPSVATLQDPQAEFAQVDDAAATVASEECGSRGLPWRTGLSSRTIVGRLTYWPLVRDAECRHGLPGGLLDALVLQESRYQPAAISRVGAAGLAQLMPKTANELGVANRFEPVANLDGGARYLRSMLDRYRSVPLALAAYNAGAGSVKRAGGIPLNGETPGYVRSVLGFWNQSVGTLPSFIAPSRAISISFSSSNPE